MSTRQIWISLAIVCFGLAAGAGGCTCGDDKPKDPRPDHVAPELIGAVKPGAMLPKATTEAAEEQYAPEGVTLPVVPGEPYAFDGIIYSLEPDKGVMSIRGTENGFNPQTRSLTVHNEAYIAAEDREVTLHHFRVGDRIFARGYVRDGKFTAVELLTEPRTTKGMKTTPEKVREEKRREAELEAERAAEILGIEQAMEEDGAGQ